MIYFVCGLSLNYLFTETTKFSKVGPIKSPVKKKLVEIAYTHMENNQYDMAVPIWKKIIKENADKQKRKSLYIEDMSTLYYNLGICFEHLQQWQNARNAFLNARLSNQNEEKVELSGYHFNTVYEAHLKAMKERDEKLWKTQNENDEF